ncbi:MAG TPA: alpha/beta fold hydrolase [Candidatus Limnocylindrales bacterium]|nr:alpha/beta fold hydrolase [Candidatus Limnocylindrales bacterium]
MQKLSFKVDGYNLAGTIFYPDKPKEKNSAIFFVHGWTGNMKNSFQYAEALSKLGFVCMLFDMRGHGESEGDIKKFTIKEFSNDVLAAYDHLVGVDLVDSENISVIGSSFGGYLISILSTKKKIRNLVLRAPADYPNEDFHKSKYLFSGSENPEIVAWRKLVKKPADTFALQAINNYRGDVLVIESEKDIIVPHESTQNYIDAIKDKNKLTHVVINDAPHSIKEGIFRNKVTNILIDWFRNKI